MGDVEEDSWWLLDESSFAFELIGGSSSPLSQRMRWKALTGRWGWDESREASGVVPLDVVDEFQPNVGRRIRRNGRELSSSV